MAAPVVSNKAGAVDREDHFLVLHGDVVDDLVVGPLQERRVDGEDRDEPALGHAAGEGHRELLRDAAVEEPVREPFRELLEAGTEGHGGRDGDDVRILFREGAERFSEFCGKVRAAGRGLPGRLVEAADAVELRRVFLGRTIAPAFHGADVQDDRTIDGLRTAEGVPERAEVVSVDGAHVVEAHIFEHVTGIEPVFQELLDADDAFDRRVAHDRDFFEGILDFVLEEVVSGVRADGREVHRERTHVRRDGHLVVIQDDDEFRVFVARVVEGFIDEAAGEGAVADDRDGIGRVALEGLGHREAVACRDRRTAVPRRERVVFTLLRVRETGKASVLPKRVERLEPPGQEFVGVNLVSDVPDEGVLRRLELEVHGKGQFHRAEVRREVPAVLRDGIHDRLPDLPGEFCQLPVIQRAQVLRRVDLFK